jgi:hypothetical protein
MILRKAVLLVAAAIATTAIAHAQIGVYGTVSVNRLTGIQGSPNAAGSVVNDSVDPIGGGAGVYYDFKTLGPIRLGADLRGTITDSKQGAYTNSRGAGTRIYSGLGGIRAVFHTPYASLKPYIQASAGIGRSDYGLLTPNTTVTVGGSSAQITGEAIHNNLQYEGFAGVDFRVLPIMDFRVVELGYGALTSFGTSGHTYPIGTISSGIVFHLPF